jgi:hypothetical protein
MASDKIQIFPLNQNSHLQHISSIFVGDKRATNLVKSNILVNIDTKKIIINTSLGEIIIGDVLNTSLEDNTILEVNFDPDVQFLINATESKSQTCSQSSMGIIYEKLTFKMRMVQVNVEKDGTNIGN